MTENKKENLPVVKEKVDLTAGIVPKDFEELNRFAQLVHRAGLSPKSFDSVEKIAIGILTNMELDRPVITGLQDLAIINGRCGIYGDASMAMITASGLMDAGYPIEEEIGKPFTDDWEFIFKVKRKGGPERTGRWSWLDAKRAGFDDPKQRDGKSDPYSPWRRFPRRMMQWKSRNYILRDVFGDVLRGMKTVEDLHDLDGIVELQETKSGEYKAIDKKPEKQEIEDLSDRILEEKPEKAEIEKKDAADIKEIKTPDTRNNVLNKAKWNRLHNENFYRFVINHKDEIVAAPDDVKEDLRAKWGRLFQDDSWKKLFELEEKPKTEQQQTPEIDEKAPEIKNTETSHNVGMSDMAEVEIVKSGANGSVDIMESMEWSLLSDLQRKYPDIYKKKIGQGVFKTIEDVEEATKIMNEAIAEQEFTNGGK